MLLAIIDDGRRTATYKLAVLLALIDCCAEGVSETGAAPTHLRTRDIARRVASLYWPQLRPFPRSDDAVSLRQITNKRSTIITVLRRVFDDLPGVGTWEAAERLAREEASRTLDVVELTVAKYPLVRLQTVDGVPQPVLYDLSWGEEVTLRRLRENGGVVPLRPQAGDQLIRLAPLLRPLVELHWVRMVASINGLDIEESDLRRHLFGAERLPFPPGLRRGLAQLQDGCFYCRDQLRGPTAIDHFMPWTRWPNDAVENLVLAHATCNSHKSDRVPGPVPLGRWAARLHAHGDELSGLAGAQNWPSRPDHYARPCTEHVCPPHDRLTRVGRAGRNRPGGTTAPRGVGLWSVGDVLNGKGTRRHSGAQLPLWGLRRPEGPRRSSATYRLGDR